MGDQFFLKAVQNRLDFELPLEEGILENYSSMRWCRTGEGITLSEPWSALCGL